MNVCINTVIYVTIIKKELSGQEFGREWETQEDLRGKKGV